MQARRVFRMALFCLALACSSFGSGFGESPPLKELQHSHWGLRDGLSGSGICVAQTKDGFLWIGTADGLFRFDGVTFQRYKPFYGELPSIPIHSLLATADGSLWVGFQENRITRINAGRATNFGPEDGIAVGRVRFLVPDADGGIFFSTTGSVMRLYGGKFEKVKMANWSLSFKAAEHAWLDSSGTFWITSEGHTSYLIKGTHAFQPVPVVTGRALSLIETPTQMGVAVEGKKDEVVWLARPRFNREALPYASYSTPMGSAKDGSVWVGGEPGGVCRERDPAHLVTDFATGFRRTVDCLNEAEGLSSNYVMAVLEDMEGDVWVVTSRGLDRFRTTSIRSPALRPDSIDLMLAVAPDGAAYYASWSNPQEQHRWTRVKDGVLLPHPSDRVRYAFPDPDGSSWFATQERDLSRKSKSDGRFWHWTSSGVHEVPRPAGLDTFRVTSLATDAQQRHWIVVDDGGDWMLDNAGWHLQSFPQQKGSRAFFSVPGVGDGVAYVTAEAVSVLVDGSPRVLLPQLPPGLTIRSVCSFKGHLLLGTNHGVGEIVDGRIQPLHISTRDSEAPVLAMLSSTRSGVWIATTRSLLNLQQVELRRYLSNRGEALQTRKFDLFGDLPDAFNVETRIVEAPSGVLWMTTPTAVLSVDPASLRTNLREPTVVVAAASVAATSVDPAGPATLEPDKNSLRIEYTSLSLPAPEKIRFRYRLEGYDERWVDTERRDVSFVGLPPGNYDFRVLGTNNDGVWNKTGASFHFTVQPRLYQATWFRTAASLTLCVLLIGGILLRERRIRAFVKAVADAREGERRQVAHQLHDDFFPSVYGLFLSINRVTKTLPEEATQRGRLQSLVEESDGVLEHGRLLIQKLRSGPGLRSDLFEELAAFGRSQEAVFSVAFVSNKSGPDVALSHERHEEACAIAREALWNAFRHSDAGTISLTMAVVPSDISIVVADDGRGLPDGVLERGKSGHFGMATMRERAATLRGKVRIDSSPKQGTIVTLTFPQRSVA